MRIAVVGGYGNAGRAIAELLARRVPADIVLLGPDGDRASRIAEGIPGMAGGSVTGGTADASDAPGLRRAIGDADLVVVASSTTASTAAIAAAVLDTGADWLDINLSSPAKLAALRGLAPRIEAAGRCFITDGGIHPGLPGALVRYAATRGPPRSAAVAACFELDWRSLRFSPATRREFLLELLDFDPSLLRDGRWRRGTRFARRFDLGPPFGRRYCVPLCMEEIRELPEVLPGLRDAGFWVAGFGPVVDWLAIPVASVMARASANLVDPAARLLAAALERFGSGWRGVAVVLETTFEDGLRLRLRIAHPDAYFITAAPAVAALLQHIDGRRPAGLHTQAAFVEPVRFVADLRSMGVQVVEG